MKEYGSLGLGFTAEVSKWGSSINTMLLGSISAALVCDNRNAFIMLENQDV